MTIPELESFYLVGGTALSLKFGHRISVDLDLFGGTDQFDREEILDALEKEFGTSFYFDGSNTKGGIFCFIDDVKVDIIRFVSPHSYP
jgi:hypothetical protein